jgi:hypothetical protein
MTLSRARWHCSKVLELKALSTQGSAVSALLARALRRTGATKDLAFPYADDVTDFGIICPSAPPSRPKGIEKPDIASTIYLRKNMYLLS